MDDTLQRVFLAIDPASWKETLYDWQHFLQKKLLSQATECSWSKLASLHLTLLFLGELPHETVAQLKKRLQQFSFKENILLEIKNAGLLNRHIVVYVESDGLLKLQHDLFQYVHKQGILVKNEHQFIPHITLGKIKRATVKKPLNHLLKELNTHSLRTVKIHEMALYQSFTGNQYEILQKYPL